MSMKLTLKASIHTKGICFAFRDTQNNPIDPLVQTDANEFLITLMD